MRSLDEGALLGKDDQEYMSWTGQRRSGMLAKQDGHGAEHAEICMQAVTWYKTPFGMGVFFGKQRALYPQTV